MTSLYHISEAMNDVKNLEDMPEDAIQDTLEGIEMEFYDKAENIMALIKNMKATSDALKNEADSLTTRKKALDNKIKKLTEYLLVNMQKTEIKKVERGPHIASITNGRNIVIIDNVDNLDDKHVRVKSEILPDKKAIMESYKAGEKIEGAHIEQSQMSLTIK
jgi:hypothetical protein